MRPRSKIHHRIIGLAQKMPDLTKEQKEYAFFHSTQHIAYKLKNGTTSCLDCGHKWSEAKEFLNIKKTECPQCGTKLKVEVTKQQKLSQRGFFGVIDVVEEFQVNRFFEIYVHHKAGEKPRQFIWEVCSQWLRPGHKPEVVSRARGGMGGHDSFHGYLEIRDRYYLNSKADIYTEAYWPKMKVLPIYKRNGFKGKFHGLTPYLLFEMMLVDSKIETLLKAKQYSLLNQRVDRTGRVERHWKSIKICMRNNYIVKDGTVWLDYLDLLHYFRKDLLNAKFICPANLLKEHSKLVAKKTEIERIRRMEIAARDTERRKRKLEQDKEQYILDKKAFFGLAFIDDDLEIKVLESVDEFEQEGKLLKHCVFSNSYYNTKTSLIFSAKINGVSVETVEVSLKQFKILQSRGLHNGKTEHNERIRAIVEKNMNKIRKLLRESKKVQTVSQLTNTASASAAA